MSVRRQPGLVAASPSVLFLQEKDRRILICYGNWRDTGSAAQQPDLASLARPADRQAADLSDLPPALKVMAAPAAN